MSAIFGLTVYDLYGCYDMVRQGQEISSRVIPQGHLSTFPKELGYRVVSISLVNPGFLNHHHCAMLHLVDPGNRIYSMSDVLPQSLHE